MEGLIPLVYRAIIQYRNGERSSMGASSWFDDPPASSYVSLPGDSGRFSDMSQFFPSTTVPPKPSLSYPRQPPTLRSTSRRHN
ncbi:hypothetical protein KSP39_PZI013418 [Platanthera zijinensis]|uniref:Uncharacterized protein n=1 Tax=Platanthera zijinensis TaxID=2320716 RepID=A0AAP0BCI0_9ASPA